MSEPGPIAMAQPPLDGEQALSSLLDALCSEGARRLDPARFHYLERLSQRMCAEHGDVRRILAHKLHAALTAYAEGFRQAQTAAGAELATLSGSAPQGAGALRRLNQHIRAATQASIGGGLGSDGDAASELRSVRRFRETWGRMAAEDQVDRAVGRGPENAGPLNSHGLVLRSLALMRDLSPDYLRRFMAHVDALLWLDHMDSTRNAAPARPRPVRRGRQKQ